MRPAIPAHKGSGKRKYGLSSLQLGEGAPAGPLSLRGDCLSLHARVLILARDDSLAGDLAEGLDRLGWRTITARGVQAATAALGDLQIEAAIIDAGSYGDAAEGLVHKVKAASGARRLP